MNIYYNSHMFGNILQSSFESSRKFKNILHYSNNFHVFPANSRKLFIFLLNFEILQMFLRSFYKYPLILSFQIVILLSENISFSVSLATLAA